MSFELPANLERKIERYAQNAHLSKVEAAAELIEAGLRTKKHAAGRSKNAALNGLGLFRSPEDAAALDDAVAIAYEERRRPSQRTMGL